MSDWNTSIIEEFRANGGKVGGQFDGSPLILIHHIGARSGTEHVTPVGCFPQSDGRLAIIASNGGAPRNPDWYYNLKAGPEIDVEFGTETFAVAVRELDSVERERVWAAAVGAAPQLREHRNKTTRTIPVLLLAKIFSDHV
jgi:deazaflavin-dependent oxidoreductase (nitroreductase family)